MEYSVDIKNIDQDTIEVLGKKYYTEEYVKIMLERAYDNGFKNGQQMHVVQPVDCDNCLNNIWNDEHVE